MNFAPSLSAGALLLLVIILVAAYWAWSKRLLPEAFQVLGDRCLPPSVAGDVKKDASAGSGTKDTKATLKPPRDNSSPEQQ